MSRKIIGLLHGILPRTALWQVALGVAVALTQVQNATAGGGNLGRFDPRGTAYSLTEYGSISASNPQDVWTITVTATGTADLTGLTADLDLQMRRNDGTEIGRSTNGGSQPERISFSVPAGTYSFRVYRYGAAQSAYALRLNFTVSSCVTERDFGPYTNPRGFFTQTPFIAKP